MAITGLSEFTFGYAFLFEQTTKNWNGLRAAPILPSLSTEADVGWDAHLPTQATDYYYQFKLSDYLYRSNASFIRDLTYANPYYRLSLHRRDNNRQHHRLFAHAQIRPQTYYVAPEFQSVDAFNQSFLSKQISDRSRLIPIAQCDDCTDADQHYITYQPGDTGWRFHSDGKRREQSYTGMELQTVFDQARSSLRPVDTSFAEELFVATTDQVRARIVDEEGPAKADLSALALSSTSHSRAGFLRGTADVLSVFFGLTLVLVGTTE